MMNFGLSSSSQSSSSSSHYNKTSTTTATIATLVPSSLFNHHGADTKLELMDSSPRQNNEDDVGCRGEDNNPIIAVEKEHMFDKVVTPSDVGKLNRLVIPKQHAEKYFPLDSTSNEKGLLLNFEDRNGKPWRFRYSYWNSSQSYVMTKGWSRFVKEKKLDAGDIVSFQRGLGELGKDRLFIDWRRRPDAPDPSHHHHGHHPLQFHHQHYPPNFAIPHQQQQQHFSWNHHQHHRSVPWSPLLMRPPGGPMAPRDHMSSPQMNYGVNLHHHPYRSSGTSSITGGGGSSGGGGSAYGYGNVVSSSGPIYYLRSASSASSGPQQFPEQDGSGLQHQLMLQQQREVEMGRAHEANMVLESVPVVHGKAAAAAKRLRLFGVNMECPVSDQSDECDILSSISSSSSPSSSHYHPHHHHQYHAPSTTTTTTMPLQLRLYDGTPHHSETTAAATTTDFLSGGKAASPSSMSLDFDV